jgi:hypothetical protein
MSKPTKNNTEPLGENLSFEASLRKVWTQLADQLLEDEWAALKRGDKDAQERISKAFAKVTKQRK